MNARFKNLDRQTWIDAVKGFGILLVILGHTFDIPTLLGKFIYSFHMPMFFIISGLLFNSEKYRDIKAFDYIKIKFRSYLLPYYIYCFLNLIFQIIWKLIFLRQIISVKEVIGYILAILYCYAGDSRMPNCSSVWFLMCLFWASLFIFIINKYAYKYSYFIAILSLVISYFIDLFVDFRLPFNLSTAFMATFFIWFGIIVRKFSIVTKIYNMKSWIITIIVICMSVMGLASAYFNSLVGMNENEYGNVLLFLASSIFLSLSVFVFSKKVSIFRNRYFVYLGKNTMLIIGFNFIVRDFMTEIYYLSPLSRFVPYNWLISFIITTIVFTMIIFLHNKIKSIFKRRFS